MIQERVQENYSGKIMWLMLWVVILISGVTFLSVSIQGYAWLRKLNMLSDVVKYKSEAVTSLIPDYEAEIIVPETSVNITDSIMTGAAVKDSLVIKNVPLPPDVVPIEDYSAKNSGMSKFYYALNNIDTLERSVRILFLGDSFIEGDLFTAELRDLLQDTLGGKGVGFVNITSPVNKFRQTVMHEYSDWQTYSISKQEDPPAWYKIGVCGQYSMPAEGAVLQYKMPANRSVNLRSVSSARIFFRNEADTKIYVSVNDGEEQEYSPSVSTAMQSLSFGPNVRDIKFRFENTEGFTAYGVLLDDKKGISVDNYALRGASGTHLTSVSSTLNKQWTNYAPADLVILEYGLNVVAEGVMDYSYYRVRMKKSIEHIKEIFPDADILLMGMGDRSAKIDGTMQTMPEVKSMVAMQRAMAKEAGIAFWSIFDAMGGENGMVNFVERDVPWAAKDYTHISALGGRAIAKRFFKALMAESAKYQCENTN